ncbi:hypothetical protein [Chelativorans sp. M5D2P16]|uniref:hypothetical protein n=1 Tax=Chelativorans sp. M5D2P16 TaxID=3095678 RepID=UPI002ACABDDA|nr:hypothetical protein [Chelativorans sp. M5D2P16]MDZ5695809.1 hypothetical protein [Chelativorans sp. M5D2P16]
MCWKRLANRLAIAGLAMTIAAPALSFEEQADGFWPCVQRKVPQLSLPQIWNGPQLPEAAENWQEDPEVSALVTDVAQRRVPLEEAQQQIRDFAGQVSEDKREERLFKLVRGLFDQMDSERSEVMAGIERYTRKQVRMADALRQQTDAVDRLRKDPDADPQAVAERVRQLDFQTRVYQERAQSLTYVCEVPTLIEQRLYRLANTVATLLAPSNGG